MTVASPPTLVVTTEASFPVSLNGDGGWQGTSLHPRNRFLGGGGEPGQRRRGRHQQRRRDAANGLKPSLTLAGEVGTGWVPTTLAWCWR